MPVSAVFKPCIVIPCYNHGSLLGAVIDRLQPFDLPVLLVDDGSDGLTRQVLDALCAQHAHLTLLRLPVNMGKGQAVLHGIDAASQAGFTHCVQVDADGQHCLEDLPAMLAAAKQSPQTLISGRPIYDESVPKARLYGRYVTHVWVWIETLSFALKDSMCGFRVYPVAQTLAVARKVHIGRRMDFDTEIMVRLYWDGTPSQFIPTRVIYPENGISHFDALRDNVRISWMHTRLFFGMLPRIPSLLMRHVRSEKHWSQTQERKGMSGMRFMLGTYRLLGRKVFNALLWPVVAYLWMTGRVQRQASQQWLRQVRQHASQLQRAIPGNLNSFMHFMRFGKAMLDKVASWKGDLVFGRDVQFAPGAEELVTRHQAGGRLILASHLGDIEVCRALGQLQGKVVINALVFTEHAQRFKAILEGIAPVAGVNLIPVTDIGPEVAIGLKEKLDRGEWVAIVGDRTSVHTHRGGQRRVVWSQFMGKAAPFPQGPFVLASILRCPVLLMFALQEGKQLTIHCEEFASTLSLPRHAREAGLQTVVDRYAARLEHYALLSPLDWFNFFDFWSLPGQDNVIDAKE
jgi:predicted LPLAT superfamily acyltransferase